jgi:hypothetical protein
LGKILGVGSAGSCLNRTYRVIGIILAGENTLSFSFADLFLQPCDQGPEFGFRIYVGFGKFK